MITPAKRLARMRESFEKDRSILFADYEYFAMLNAAMLCASIPQNKAERKLGECGVQLSQEQNETPSSDKSGG